MKRREWNTNYFKQNTKEVAYWAGFLMADGCIIHVSKRSRMLVLVVAKHDTEHLNRFCDAVGVSRDAIFTNKDESVGVHLSGMDFDVDLIKWGIIPRKTFNFVAPEVSNELLPHYLRGWIDGDGQVYANGDGARITIAGNIPAMEWCINAFRRIGYSGGVNIYKRTDTHGILYAGGINQVHTLITLLLVDGEFKLERKWSETSHYDAAYSGEVRTCVVCGKEIFVRTSRAKNPKYGKYCSKACRGMAERKEIVDGKCQCARCKQWVFIEQFSGNNSYCKPCWREMSRERRQRAKLK